ncbi:hypothetical protein C2S51_026748 [Perilla frutescens var. frutescens]|nr:hypothetical protein C2S51_026748 [Perilla frutescens var. frutescens]
MDDEFLVLQECSEIMSWLEEIETPDLQPIRETAFERYTMRLPLQRHACNSNSNSNPNANKRMIEFLRNNPIIETTTTTTQQARKRSMKHMMMERMRRKKHSQIYLALHHLLPQGTKSDKKSILETAVKEVEELRRRHDELRRRNEEIMEMIYNYEAFEKEKCELDLKVENPGCAVDSMLEVLRCLKNVGCLTTSIQSTFFHHHFAATLHFQTTCWMRMRAAEVEKAVQRSLLNAEINFRQAH